MHQIAYRPKDRITFAIFFNPRLQQHVHMIGHNAHGEEVVTFLIEVAEGVEYDGACGRRENARFSSTECYVVDAVRTVVMWKTALRIMCATRGRVRQDAERSTLEARAPQQSICLALE